MQKLFFALFMGLPLLLFSQKNHRLGRTYSDILPENFQFEIPEVRNHAYSVIPEKIKSEFNPRVPYHFAHETAVDITEIFYSGKVYSDWPALENYVNEILKKVIPEELAADTMIKVYLLKSGDYNAFMTPTGIFFLDIGIFNETATEAELAGVFAHEVAHYYLQHSLHEYIKKEKGDFNRVFRKTSRSKYSIQNELQADSMAISWLSRTGFGIQGVKQAAQSLDRIKEQATLVFGNMLEERETTHPAPKRRIAQVDSFAVANNWHNGADFLVSKERFYTFKELVKPEILRHLLNSFAYEQCIELAFKFHVISPNRPEFVYFLMESIRRLCYFKPHRWKKNFIIDRYSGNLETTVGTKKKVDFTGHLFKQYIPEIIGISKEDFETAAGNFYWDGEVKFETYREAFDFFAQVAELLNEPECLLSQALTTSRNSELRKELLNKYLTHDNIQYRDYAIHLLNDQIFSALPSKTLTVMMNVFPWVHQGSDYISLQNTHHIVDSLLKPITQGITADAPYRTPLNAVSFLDNRLNDYVLLEEMHYLCTRQVNAWVEIINLHLLDPRYWNFMQKLGINEIDFLDLHYMDKRGGENSMEAYQKVINTTLPELFNETKRHRYLEARVLSIRIKPKSYSNIDIYGKELKIDYNKPATETIIQYFQKLLKEKEAYAEQYDGKQE